MQAYPSLLAFALGKVQVDAGNLVRNAKLVQENAYLCSPKVSALSALGKSALQGVQRTRAVGSAS